MSKSGLKCHSGVADNTNGYSGLYLEEDYVDTMHLGPVAPYGTEYLSEAKAIFSPLYTEATRYVNSKFNEYTRKYPIDGDILKRGYDIECRGPDDGAFYHIGAGCTASPSLVIEKR